MKNENNKQEFLCKINKLLKIGKDKDGILEYKEIEKFFDGMSISKEKMKIIIDYLNDNGICVFNPYEVDENNLSDEEEILDTETITDEEKKANLNSVLIYLDDIRKFPRLSAEEVVEIFKRIEKGDKAAKQKMIESNLALVVSVAKKYSSYSMDILDLIQEGNIGLMYAINNFDYRKGYKLSSYAVCCIKQFILRAIYNKEKTIRLPVNREYTLRKIKKMSDKFRQELMREPTIEEIRAEIGLSEMQINRILHMPEETLSMDVVVDIDNDATLYDLVKDNSAMSSYDCVEFADLKKRMNILVNTVLTESEQKIIKFRFGLYDGNMLLLKEVGELTGVTRERVRQLEERILRKLRNLKKANKQLIKVDEMKQMDDEGILSLRNAIVLQAIKDYKFALNKIDKKLPRDENLLSFSERQKQIMYLRDQGLSCSEIAKKLKCSRQNIQWIVRKVIKQIQKYYGIDAETAEKKNEAINELKDIKRFFFSEWFEQLCDIDPKKIIDHVENEHKKCLEEADAKSRKYLTLS